MVGGNELPDHESGKKKKKKKAGHSKHPPLTPSNTHRQPQKKKKPNQHSDGVLGPQREIVSERQGSRAEVQMKRVSRKFLKSR